MKERKFAMPQSDIKLSYARIYELINSSGKIEEAIKLIDASKRVDANELSRHQILIDDINTAKIIAFKLQHPKANTQNANYTRVIFNNEFNGITFIMKYGLGNSFSQISNALKDAIHDNKTGDYKEYFFDNNNSLCLSMRFLGRFELLLGKYLDSQTRTIAEQVVNPTINAINNTIETKSGLSGRFGNLHNVYESTSQEVPTSDTDVAGKGIEVITGQVKSNATNAKNTLREERFAIPLSDLGFSYAKIYELINIEENEEVMKLIDASKRVDANEFNQATGVSNTIVNTAKSIAFMLQHRVVSKGNNSEDTNFTRITYNSHTQVLTFTLKCNKGKTPKDFSTLLEDFNSVIQVSRLGEGGVKLDDYGSSVSVPLSLLDRFKVVLGKYVEVETITEKFNSLSIAAHTGGQVLSKGMETTNISECSSSLKNTFKSITPNVGLTSSITIIPKIAVSSVKSHVAELMQSSGLENTKDFTKELLAKLPGDNFSNMYLYPDKDDKGNEVVKFIFPNNVKGAENFSNYLISQHHIGSLEVNGLAKKVRNENGDKSLPMIILFPQQFQDLCINLGLKVPSLTSKFEVLVDLQNQNKDKSPSH